MLLIQTQHFLYLLKSLECLSGQNPFISWTGFYCETLAGRCCGKPGGSLWRTQFVLLVNCYTERCFCYFVHPHCYRWSAFTDDEHSWTVLQCGKWNNRLWRSLFIIRPWSFHYFQTNGKLPFWLHQTLETMNHFEHSSFRELRVLKS